MFRTIKLYILVLFALLFAPGALNLAPLMAGRSERGRYPARALRPHKAEARVDLSRRRYWYASGTPMTAGAFPAITNREVALRAIFFEQMQAIAGDSLLNRLFNVQDSTDAQEKEQGISGLSDIPEYKGAIEYDSLEQLYSKTFVHKAYARGMAIERELLDDDKYGVMGDRARLLGMAFDRTIEKHAVSVFGNAFSGSVTGGDGVALCGAHPYSPTDAATQSNTGTSALTHSALEDTIETMMLFKDSTDNVMPIIPDTLIVPVSLKATAEVIVGSQLRSDNANNNMNSLNGSLNVIVSRYLTDQNNWFVVDSRMAKMFLKWYWRVRPEFALDPTSDFSLMLKFRGYMRYSFGWTAWQWIYGHNVS